MRVPQAMSTNRALAVTGDGTTALMARFAVPEEVEADGVTGSRAGESWPLRATAPTATRPAARAACLVAVGAVALNGQDSPARLPVTPSASTSSGTANLAMSAVVPSPVTASARLVDMAWGTRIDLTCSYSAKGSYPTGGSAYALVVIDRSGAEQQVATWSALPNRELTVLGASSLARRDIAAVEIRTLSGKAILRLST